MLVLGILGYPVSHTKSPAMHNAAARELGLDATYVPFAVKPEHVGDAVRGVRALGIHGVNVTVPHKQAVMPFLDDVHAHARAIGAVNTIVREGDRLIGHNTDAPGLVRSLEEAGVALEGSVVTILGAGGAARAAVVGLAHAGAKAVHVVARRQEQARELVDSVAAALPCEAHAHGTDAQTSLFGSTTLLVQSTSATLAGSEQAEPFAKSLPLAALPGDAVICDLVYKPLETTVLRDAKARGLRTVDGLGMLLHQGAIAFELWTGRKAPVEVMRRALG